MDSITVSVGSTTYSIVAMQDDDGMWHPGIAVIDASGEPITTVVDPDTTDEEYGDARTCLLRAMVHVL
jgi:hypothetical protein